MKHFFRKYQWNNWLYNEKIFWPKVIWFACIIMLLALLDGTTKFIWLVPPFSATLTILILLPKSSIAQPIPVIVGSTLAAVFGTIVSLMIHGPVYAALVATIMVIVLTALRIYHPPAIALSMYPLLLHTGIFFPVIVVFPFTFIAVVTCYMMSSMFKSWGKYPLPIHKIQ
ncbi:MAG: HPP family protein [Chitinophagaceae bacterium]|nr:MAG: HPP family protein [Chitinophagaceae bacterium]